MRDANLWRAPGSSPVVRCPRQSYSITRAMCHARQRAGLCRSLHCENRLGEGF